MGDDCSIWYQTVLRGDVNSIRLGREVNVQDGSILHCLYQRSVILIGNHVSIGHNVVIHGAEIHDYALVGIGAIVLDHSVIGEQAIIAAGSVVLEGTKVEAGSIYGGIPARKIKEVDPHQTREMNLKIAKNYLLYAEWYK